MATPAEFLYEACTCEGGMRDGARCADCGGRGIVSKGTKVTGQAVDPDVDATLTASDDLDNLSIVDLRATAKASGLSAGGGREALTARIRAAARDDSEAADGAHTASDEADDDQGDETSDGDET